MEESVTHYIDSLSNGRAIVACGEKVYVMTLPVQSAAMNAKP